MTVKFFFFYENCFNDLLDLFDSHLLLVVHSNDVFVILAQFFRGKGSFTYNYSDSGGGVHLFAKISSEVGRNFLI